MPCTNGGFVSLNASVTQYPWDSHNILPLRCELISNDRAKMSPGGCFMPEIVCNQISGIFWEHFLHNSSLCARRKSGQPEHQD